MMILLYAGAMTVRDLAHYLEFMVSTELVRYTTNAILHNALRIVHDLAEPTFEEFIRSCSGIPSLSNPVKVAT
jgi:hypothetical protein